MSVFNSIPSALQAFKQGELLIVVDDENRENEGDLVLAAEKATPEKINFIIKHGRGLMCVPLTEKRATELDLPPMVEKNTESSRTNFTVAVDAKKGTTTGISAFDRTKTIKVLANPRTKPDDLARPGHIFPLIAREGGVLVRAGHTEAVVDLARLASLKSIGVLCEIIKEDGRMARLPDLQKFAQKFKLKIITIKDLITYRQEREKLIEKKADAHIDTSLGRFKIIVYESKIDKTQHIALVKGTVKKRKNVLVRVHSECMTGDVFGCLKCDCHEQLHAALAKIAQKKQGVLLYMRQEGRGIGLINKIKAYQLQEKGMDTVEANLALGLNADLRHYGLGAQVLADLGLSEIHLMTNNPRKIVALEGYGLKVTKRIPLETKPSPKNKFYLKTKKQKMGHLLNDL